MVLAVAAGGAIGASMRYLVGVGFGRWLNDGFPWATLTVNILGQEGLQGQGVEVPLP